MTMTVIQHIELTSSQASITFSSIPQTYTDLQLVISLRSNSTTDTDDPVSISFNGSTSNFSYKVLTGSGTLAETQSGTTNRLRIDAPTAVSTANTFCNASVYIPNYLSSNNKSFSLDGVNENNTTNAYYGGMIGAYLWSNTAAINAISLAPTEGTAWVSGSSATLYGITKGSLPGVTVS